MLIGTMRLFIGTEDQDELRAAATWAQHTGIADVLHRSLYVVLTWWARSEDGYDAVPGRELHEWLGDTVMEWKARPGSDVVGILRRRMASRGIWLVIRKHEVANAGAGVSALRRGTRAHRRARA